MAYINGKQILFSPKLVVVDKYNEGYEAGHEVGYTKGHADGIQSEYDKFWDVAQENGKRTNYYLGFSYRTIKNNNFYPKYDITPIGNATNMFYAFNHGGSTFDFVARLQECGVTLDTSGVTNADSAFNSANVSTLPKLDFSGFTGTLNTTFAYAQAITIEEIVFNENAKFTNTFQGETRLINITASGTIGNTISFSSCPLSVASMKSIINALKDYSGTDKEGANTISFSSECWNALETDSTAPTGTTWREYVQNKGWAI